VGVVCGRAALMKRYREERPADICFARGTFNAHPYVMGAMQVFLERLREPEIQRLYQGLDECWDGRARQLNAMLEAAALPVRVANLTSVWTVTYDVPSRYNWMLQFYLREQGLALSWVGSGRLIFSHNYTQRDFDEVARRFVAAAARMKADGWWWHVPQATNRSVRRGVLKEMVRHWRRG
jgi:glutamate-1-semialdehyde 2,1-aminomutase